MQAGALPRHARLLARAEFLAAAKGRRFHTERLTLQGRPKLDEETGLRIGLTVTRKVGHATERNRIRRRLRSAGAMLAGEAETATLPLDVVVIARRDILSTPFPTLVDDLRRGLRAVSRPSRAARPSR